MALVLLAKQSQVAPDVLSTTNLISARAFPARFQAGTAGASPVAGRAGCAGIEWPQPSSAAGLAE